MAGVTLVYSNKLEKATHANINTIEAAESQNSFDDELSLSPECGGVSIYI